ncbi:hypothetical protein GGR56DRAFT_671022 [Xylariaceae sp. FL0804]|nr:hypothetical protein GGR56DRAFT_671022 [Xylariaceae sp. FL0804]
MRTSAVYASALAFAASAQAQVLGFASMTNPTDNEVVAAGTTLPIVWQNTKYSGDVTIELLGGKTPNTLVVLETLATVPITDKEYDWATSCSDAKYATYGIKITSVGDSSLFQYSFPFSLKACESASTSSSSSSSSSSTTEVSYPTTVASSGAVATSSAAATTSVAVVYTTSCPASSSTPATTLKFTTSYPAGGNYTMTRSASAIVGSSTPAVVAPGSSATPSTSTIPTAGASKAGAGSIALLGGLAAMVMLL